MVDDERKNSQISSSKVGVAMEPFVMYKRRWIGLICIWLLNVSTGLAWLTYNAVPQISATWLNSGGTEVNLSVVLYFVGSIVSSNLSSYIFEKFGIKKALLVGGVINIVGSWIRYAAVFIDSTPESNEGRLAVTLVGQFIAATANPFFLNSPPKYAGVWFSDSTRAMATTIGTLSNPIAGVIAMVLIPGICTEENGDDMPMTLLVIAIFSIVAFFSIFVVSERPPTPPSASASMALVDDAEPFWTSLKKLSRNKNFIILLIAFAIYVGFFNVFSSVITQIVNPYGYTDDDGGIFGACLILAGIPGAVGAGYYIDKTKRYKTVLFICSPLLAISYISLIFVVREDFFAGIAIVCAILGVSSFSLLPVALESGVECTYPSPPSTSTATLWMSGQLSAVAFLLATDALRDEDGDPPGNMRIALIAAGVIGVFTSASSFFYNSPNYRLEAEQKAAENKLPTVEHI